MQTKIKDIQQAMNMLNDVLIWLQSGNVVELVGESGEVEGKATPLLYQCGKWPCDGCSEKLKSYCEEYKVRKKSGENTLNNKRGEVK